MAIAFSKYEGAGNDFILIDNRTGSFQPTPQAVARLCDRHFGIGADGLMTLTADEAGTCVMRYFNADGSEGEMCGNGARCFTLFVRHLGLCEETCRFEATDGPHEALLRNVKGETGEIEVGMIPVSEIRKVGDGWALNTGVPTTWSSSSMSMPSTSAVAAGKSVTMRHSFRRERTSISSKCGATAN